MSELTRISADILILIALELDPSTVLNLCEINKEAYTKLCNNPNFWHRKTIKDFRYIPNILRLPNYISRKDIYQYLYNKTNNPHIDYVLEAILNNDIKTVHIAILLRENINRNQPNGRMSYLVHAIRSGNYDMVKFLIDNNANVNDKVNIVTFISPLAFALNINSPDKLKIIKLLLENGADPNYANKVLHPLNLAIRANEPEIVKLLLYYGADPNKKNIYNKTSFDMAASEPEILKILEPYNSNI